MTVVWYSPRSVTGAERAGWWRAAWPVAAVLVVAGGLCACRTTPPLDDSSLWLEDDAGTTGTDAQAAESDAHDPLADAPAAGDAPHTDGSVDSGEAIADASPWPDAPNPTDLDTLDAGNGGDDAIPPDGGGSASWPPLAGTLTAGTWTPPLRLDSADGGYGRAAYAPSGDLYVFYSVLPPSSAPKPDALKLRRRLAGSATFAPETEVMDNGRTAHPHFPADGSVLVAIENSGTATVYASKDGQPPWTWQVSYVAMTGIGDGAWNDAVLTGAPGSLRLWYGLTAYSTVTGGAIRQVYTAGQKNGIWPDMPVDLTPYQSLSHGLQAVAVSESATLVFASKLFAVGATGIAEASSTWPVTTLDSACQSTTDTRLFAVELQANSATVWGSADWGGSFLPLASIAPGGAVSGTAIAAAGNRVLAVARIGGDSGGSALLARYSLDGGASWSAVQDVVDLTGSGASVSAFSMAGAQDGRITLVYATEAAGKRSGVYVLDWQ